MVLDGYSNPRITSNPNEHRTITQKFASFSTTTQNGLAAMKNQEFLAEILKLLQEFSDLHPNLQNHCEETVFQVLKKGQDLEILTQDQSAILANLLVTMVTDPAETLNFLGRLLHFFTCFLTSPSYFLLK